MNANVWRKLNIKSECVKSLRRRNLKLCITVVESRPVIVGTAEKNALLEINVPDLNT